MCNTYSGNPYELASTYPQVHTVVTSSEHRCLRCRSQLGRSGLPHLVAAAWILVPQPFPPPPPPNLTCTSTCQSVKNLSVWTITYFLTYVDAQQKLTWHAQTCWHASSLDWWLVMHAIGQQRRSVDSAKTVCTGAHIACLQTLSWVQQEDIYMHCMSNSLTASCCLRLRLKLLFTLMHINHT